MQERVDQEFVAGDARRVPGAVSMIGYRSRGQPESSHLGVPSATLTFILSLDGPVIGADTAADLAVGRTASSDIVISGLHEHAAHIWQPSRQEGLQLALSPLAARAVLGMPAAELPGGMHDSIATTHLRSLWQRTGECSDWNARFALVARQFMQWAAEREMRQGPRPDVVEAWQLLARTRGGVAIDEVAKRVLLSPRQLRQEFRREFGVSPKGAARLMRFDNALARMTAAVRAGRAPSLASVAADCGYADQSHFTREAQGYLGLAPGQWLEQERRNIQVGGHGYHRDSSYDIDDTTPL